MSTATQDTSNEDELDTTVDDVETDVDTDSEDEDTDQDDQDSEDDDKEVDEDSEDSDDDDSDDEEDDDEDEEPEFKKAFSQIKGDTPDEYIPNLEEAYRKSSREAKKLVGDKRDLQTRLDQIDAAVAKDPKLAEAIKEATGDKSVAPNVDPALALARQEYEQKVTKDLETFLKEAPDLEEDEELMDEFMENVATVGAASRAKGQIISPLKAYKKAWAMMDHDDSKQQIAAAAKNSASKPKSGSAKKKSSKSDVKVSAEEIAIGKKMGRTKEQIIAQKKADAKAAAEYDD